MISNSRSAQKRRLVRIWDETRTSHFELLAGMQESTLIYRTVNFSFDSTLAAGLRVSKLGWWKTILLILRGDYDYLEMNEPTMLKIWPILLSYSVAFRVRWLNSARRPIAILYAIDNADTETAFARRIRLPDPVARWIFRRVFRFLLRTFDRVAFGTVGARRAYSASAGSCLDDRDTTTIEQIPSPCACGKPSKQGGGVLFVGEFNARKGVERLITAWPQVSRSIHSATLTIIGKGELSSFVQEWAASTPNVTLLIDPPRSVVHDHYRTARVVVLLSSPEQIGLPIVEGLAHGCEIVSGDQTGIAAWLRKSGHQVVSVHALPSVHAAAICAALESGRDAEAMLACLPPAHTRAKADLWLTR